MGLFGWEENLKERNLGRENKIEDLNFFCLDYKENLEGKKMGKIK